MASVRSKHDAGKNADYRALVKSDILPGMQNAKAAGKITGYSVAIRGMGTPTGEFSTIVFHSKFADLDGQNPRNAARGQEAATKIGDRTNQLSTAQQTIVRRRLPDLSF